ncbi:MAG TPA: PQQ-binding-like beta-propeller repeat protein, partial [Gemmatimonadales bacterium]|nr:PQQ-binding-like beta-propeller repeat protein [Gemmatimonadales bacterium]
QIAKSGFVFLFDRQSGAPLFPVEERPVPASDLRGEHAWPTQPFPVKPVPFARQAMTPADVIDLKRFRTLRANGLFTPPSREGSIVLPGFDGGGEWGGAAVDPETAVLYVNGSDVPWIAAMRDARATPGPRVYATACASCHGADRRGQGRAPSLVGLRARLSRDQVQQVIERGRGFMPAFARLSEPELRALLEDLGYSGEGLSAHATAKVTAPYEFVGYERWRDSSGLPAIRPPWGRLSAIDLNTGQYLWRIPLGGEQYGGPIVTAGGLLFIAATQDAKFHAFDTQTGKLLWEATLPAPGYATPSTYAVRGKQYVVVAAGGGKLGSKSSDAYVAFALP